MKDRSAFLADLPFSWLRAEWMRLQGRNQNLHREDIADVELERLRRSWEAPTAEVDREHRGAPVDGSVTVVAAAGRQDGGGAGRELGPQPAGVGEAAMSLAPCPLCDANWRRTEILGEARKGGGYRLKCRLCRHEWDDVHASHGERETARRKEMKAAAGSLSARPSRPVAHRGRRTLLAFACVLIAASGAALCWPLLAGPGDFGWLGWPVGAVGFVAGVWFAADVRRARNAELRARPQVDVHMPCDLCGKPMTEHGALAECHPHSAAVQS